MLSVGVLVGVSAPGYASDGLIWSVLMEVTEYASERISVGCW